MKKKSLLIVSLFAITFIIYSAVTPLLVQIIYHFFYKQDTNNLGITTPQFADFSFSRWFQDANVTAFFFSWFFILFVLFPYFIFYKGTSLHRISYFYKFLFFFFLMLVAGLFFVPWGFVTEFFLRGKYPQKVVLLFSLSIIICPMINFVLDRYLKLDNKIIK